MNITLNQKSQRSIEKSTGIGIQDLVTMDATTIDAKIEAKTGKKRQYLTKMGSRLIGRGSVYLFLVRLLSLDIIDRKLSKI